MNDFGRPVEQQVHPAERAKIEHRLLAVLGDVGIPAYINAVAASGHQAGGHRGHHQLVRLWVEAHQVTRARQLAASVVGRAAVT